MTPEEQQMLTALSDRISSAPVQQRDPDAEQMIGQLVRARPDTPYILAQTVLMQDFALRNAQAQIADLQRQLAAQAQAPRSGGSFLGNLFGHGAPQTGSVPPSGPWSQPQPQAYAPPPYSGGYAPVVMQPSQTSGFLRQAATTAAGIAGGALLFEGIQSLFSGHGGYGGGFGGMGGGWGGDGFTPRESLSETTIINNNYGDQSGGQDSSYQSDAYNTDPGFQQNDSGNQDTGFQDISDTGSDFSGGSDSDYT